MYDDPTSLAVWFIGIFAAIALALLIDIAVQELIDARRHKRARAALRQPHYDIHTPRPRAEDTDGL